MLSDLLTLVICVAAALALPRMFGRYAWADARMTRRVVVLSVLLLVAVGSYFYVAQAKTISLLISIIISLVLASCLVSAYRTIVLTLKADGLQPAWYDMIWIMCIAAIVFAFIGLLRLNQ